MSSYVGLGDYDAMTETVTFTVGSAQGSIQRQIFKTINEDELIESSETFIITFEPMQSPPDTNNFAIGTVSTSVVTIIDDDGKLIYPCYSKTREREVLRERDIICAMIDSQYQMPSFS